MKNFSLFIKLLFTLFLGAFISGGVVAQTCTTPVFTSIGNSGPVCQGGTLTLNAAGTVGGVSSGFIRMAGIGANQGDRAFDQVFSSGDRAGSIARITNAQFDAIFAGLTTDADRATAIKAKYDVLMFTWASPSDAGLTWSLVKAYLSTGGSIFVDGDYTNVLHLYDGTSSSVVGVSAGTTYGCNYTLVSPAPFPSLVANGVTGCFANDHLYVTSWPTWMKAYITASGRTLAIAGIYPSGNQGRLIVQGPDQDYHASRGAGGTAGNQYQIMLNQIDFLKANQSGITWTGPNGFTSNDALPVITNVTAANAGVYTATLTNITGGGCFVTATTTVVVNSTTPIITASGPTSLCTGCSVTLTSSSGSTYHWSNGATTQSITVSTAGNYSVTVTNTGGCSGTSAVTAVTVNPLPVATVAADGPTTFCPSGSVTLTASPAASYLWTTGDTTQSISVHVTGNYSVTVKNTSGCSATSVATAVTVQDTENPVFTSTQANVIVALDAIAGTAVLGDYTATVTATDNCSISGITQFPLAGTPLVINVPTTVTLTVSDPSGNSSTQKFTVTATDQTAPVILTKNITVALDASGNAVITPAQVDNGSTDNVGITASTLDKTTFDCSKVGDNTVNLTISDAAGNQTTGSAIVTVKDTIAPIALAQHISVQLDATGNAVITPAMINNGSTDNCAIATYALDKSAFDCSNFGDNTVTLTVTDVHGNVSTATAVVTVQDNVAPIAIAQNITVQLDATGNAVITPAMINNGSTDNCAIATYALDKSAFDCSNFGANKVTLTVTDIHGNVSTATAVVTVQDNIAPVVLTKNITVQLNALGAVSIAAAQINNGSTDNCGIATYSLSKSSFDCSNVGPNTVTLTVTDIHGNVASGIATVTVQDNIAPIVLTKNITIQLSATGDVSITPAMVNNGSTDNCGIQTYGLSKSTFDCSNVGANTVTLTVVDNNGNTSTGTAIVTVQDNIAPIITQPLSQQICFVASNIYSLPALVATDNCGVASISYVMSGATTRSGNTADASGLLNTGLTTISWKVTDNNGNVSTATNTIQIWPLPVVSIGTNSPDDFCNQVTLTANSNIAAVTYNWVYNNTPFSTNQVINLNQVNRDGVYSLYVTDVHGCTNTLVASYNFVRQNISNMYTILAYKEVELGQNNTVASGSVGVMSAKGDLDLEKGSSVASMGAFVKAPKMDVNDKSVNVPNRIYGVATVVLPTMYYNAANTKGLPNYEVKSGTVTLSGNYGNVNIRKGASAILNGNTFGTIHLEQTASVKFSSATVNIDKLQIDPSTSKAGYTNVSFASDTRVLVSTSVSIGGHAIINANNYKVTFYVGTTTDKSKGDDDWNDDARFSVNGGDVKLIANVYMPTGKLRINGGSSSDDDNDDCYDSKTNKMVAVNTYMTGLFIASEVEGSGKNVIWNNYNCSAPTSSVNPLTSISNFASTQNADTIVTETAKPILKLLAYPNPFGKRTTVAFSVPTFEQNVTLEVYNGLGNKVATLYKGSVQANVTNSYVFDGSNLAAGMYFVRLLTSGGVQTFRLVMAQ